jgi:hypothetical protein
VRLRPPSPIDLLLCALAACSRASDVPSTPSPSPPASSASALTLPPAPAPSPALTPAPSRPSDVPSEIRLRTTAARAEFGPATAPTVVRDVFLLFSADHGALFDSAVSLSRRALPLLLDGRFGREPDHAVSVYVFSTDDAYHASCKGHRVTQCDKEPGSYQSGSREAFVDVHDSLSNVVRVIVHPLVQADFPSAPTWIGDGLGALFETPRFSPAGEIHGDTNFRLPVLKEAMASPTDGDGVRLDTLFTMSDEAFKMSRPELHVAMARYFCQWLDERGLLWRFYQQWRDAMSQDPRGQKTFLVVSGQDPASATPAWRAWVQSLRHEGP